MEVSERENGIAMKNIDDKLFMSVATSTLSERKEMQLEMGSSIEANHH